jgi:glyoxylase-like metal-dependent hydrolase (beta-lactamase superfamily II)
MTESTLPNGVMLLRAPNPSLLTGPGTNTFLVADGEDGCSAIDPGPDDAGHLDHIAAAAARHGGLQTILITHGHPDHAEGAAHLRALSGAPILAWSRAGTPDADATLADEQVVPIGGRRLRALHTPGHRFDHLCFLLEDAGALFAGDLVAGVGTVVIAPPEGNLLDYMASLRRLLALDLAIILPAHGPAIERPQTLLEQYIAHREEREQQVLAALAGGPSTVAALVAGIYVDVDFRLHAMAAMSVTAHLLKLEQERRVTREMGSEGAEVWRLV